ncbi:MAG: hypothetical protein P8X74_13355 [Reinekea sp.]
MIYSSAVEKLYCEYVAHLTGPIGRQRLVVLPDFKKYDSIYNRVSNEAIIETSVHIYPRVHNGKTQLIVSGTSTSSGKMEKLPINQGLKALKMGYFDKKKIFPVLKLGDLREFPEKRLPYLRLHTVEYSQLSSLSDFEQQDIARGAWEKLATLI